MGTRAQVKIEQYGNRAPVYLYQHYDGYNLPDTVRKALKKGRGSWNDECYLARIIFCEMVKDDIAGTTGYGIDTEEHGDIEVLVEILQGQKVRIGSEEYTFEEFINK